MNASDQAALKATLERGVTALERIAQALEDSVYATEEEMAEQEAGDATG